MKLSQLTSYSLRSTVSIFANAINFRTTEVNIDNVLHVNECTPLIPMNELDRLIKDFSTFNKEFSMVRDSTHLYDEQFSMCYRQMKGEGL